MPESTQYTPPQDESNWKSETTSSKRIEQVLQQTLAPISAAEFAERALVSESTARRYLEEYVEKGVAEVIRDEWPNKYRRSEVDVVQQRIREVQTTHSRDELHESIHEINQRIQSFREQYNVDSPEELSQKLESADRGWDTVQEWRGTRRRLAIFRAALALTRACNVVSDWQEPASKR